MLGTIRKGRDKVPFSLSARGDTIVFQYKKDKAWDRFDVRIRETNVSLYRVQNNRAVQMSPADYDKPIAGTDVCYEDLSLPGCEDPFDAETFLRSSSDMVFVATNAHTGKPEYLIALGGGGHRFSLDSANAGLGLDISFSYYGSDNFTELFYRRIGDQRWFLEAGIPSVMFTSGITDHTNKRSDTPETLAPQTFAKRCSLISRWIISML